MRLERLHELATLESNWDGYGAKRITDAALAQADSLEVVPQSDGGVQLELHRAGDDLEISIGPGGKIVSVSWEGR